LASPEDEDSLPKMMQRLSGHYARYFNKCYRRSGSMWEGRYKASFINSDDYLLKCYRYIELNPVRAGMVESPERYPWSSYRENAGYVIGARPKSVPEKSRSVPEHSVRLKSDTSKPEESNMLTPHPVYLALSSNKEKRHMLYCDLFKDEIDRQH
jgi:REP-associated tyrosine transposase